WAVFAQNVPAGCFRGTDATDGPDGPGKYVRKHNPAISFRGISGDPARCAGITDFSHFDPTAADFEMVIPNLCNDMHDCSVATGDAFLRSFVPRITDSPAFAHSVLFITWDEGTSGERGSRVRAGRYTQPAFGGSLPQWRSDPDLVARLAPRADTWAASSSSRSAASPSG